jgi:NitT/TauT family transport system ATP-binding protein
MKDAADRSTAPLVRLRDVGKVFASGAVALARLDLDVAPGEFLSLLGPSGCGKSTALRLIAGLVQPTGGEILWPRGGHSRADLGYVFQDATLMPWASVFDNVWLPLRIAGQSRREAQERIGDALALVGLSRFAKAYPRELSGGMRMRVSIARALVQRPKLLLLDEPFAALDEITRTRLNGDLLRLKQELGATIIFVTHSVYESVYLSTRIAVFSARPGRIVETLRVSEPYPRSEEFRLTPLYAEKCRAASRALAGAMSAADEM